ncbi:MAG: UPF0175 family protein [Pyrinomonadaceae bacterium]
MSVNIEIPETIFRPENTEISREVLEAVAIEGFASDQLTTSQVKRLLGFETRLEVYAFLAKHNVPWVKYSVEDLERERKFLRELIP